MTKFYVRPSALQSFFNCPLSVQLSSEVERVAPTMQTTRGTVVHALIEDFILHGTLPPEVSDVADVARAIMNDRDEPIDHVPASYLWSMAGDALKAARSWVDQYWDLEGQFLEIVAVEEKLEMSLGHLDDGTEIMLAGTPDLITINSIIDFKTSTAGWSDSKMNEQYQHLSYAALAQAQHNSLPRKGVYVVYNFKTGEWEWSRFTVQIRQDDVDRALRAYFKMGKALHYQTAIGTPGKRGASWGQDGRGWWCSPKWCDAWEICDDKYLLDDGKADDPVDHLVTWR